MTKNRTTTIPSETTSVKYENYTKNILQKDSNPVTMKASTPPATESSDQTKAAKHEPLVYRVEEIAQLLAIPPVRRTTCATPRRIFGYYASAPASG